MVKIYVPKEMYMTNREIKDLMRFFDGSDISKVKIKNGEFSIELQKGFEGATVVAAPTAVAAPVTAAPVVADAPAAVAPAVKEIGDSIKSPMVGTFYAAPAPGAEAFVKVGTVVKKGQTVAIVEAMKIMNEIEAEFDCRILEILLEDGQPVEYDMPLFVVEKV
jgi:acetyl-CoA carboxylase biotin carboxyl carrier protein